MVESLCGGEQRMSAKRKKLINITEYNKCMGIEYYRGPIYEIKPKEEKYMHPTGQNGPNIQRTLCCGTSLPNYLLRPLQVSTNVCMQVQPLKYSHPYTSKSLLV